MASVRNLKKDIDVVMSIVVNDCFLVLEQNSNVKEENILEIVKEVMVKHRKLRVMASHPDGKDNPKLVKKFYHELITDLLSSANNSFEKLSAEVKKVAE